MQRNASSAEIEAVLRAGIGAPIGIELDERLSGTLLEVHTSALLHPRQNFTPGETMPWFSLDPITDSVSIADVAYRRPSNPALTSILMQ
jgi:hypothetical protein